MSTDNIFLTTEYFKHQLLFYVSTFVNSLKQSLLYIKQFLIHI